MPVSRLVRWIGHGFNERCMRDLMRQFEIFSGTLRSRGAGLFLLGCLGAAYIAAYFGHPLFPGFDSSGASRGWLTWTDQSRYVVESLAIAQLQLDATTYFYPLGYPLLGAVFVKWMPNNPFFIPNLLLILGAGAIWWKLAQRWLNPIAALAMGMAFVFSHPWLIRQTMVVPWNTIATQFTVLAGIAIVIHIVDTRAVRWLALLAAGTYLMRPIDAVTFVPLLVFATVRLPTWRTRLLSGAVGLAIVGSAVVGVGCFNLWLIGQWRTPYEIVSTHSIGFFSYPVSYKFFWLFVDGQPLFGETDRALLFRYTWLFLALPAMLFLVLKERWAGAAVLVAIVLNVTLYVNYNDLLPSDIYRFTLIHYISWAFPLLFLLVAAACREVVRSCRVLAGFGLSGLAVVLCVGLRLEPRPVEILAEKNGAYALPPTRPLLIEVPGAPMELVQSVRLDGRQLVEYSEYLVPYVPADLRLLLGMRTTGIHLKIIQGAGVLAPPVVRRYVFVWRPVRERLDLFAKQKDY